MSTYITMEGQMTFPTQETLDAAIKELTDGHWMKENRIIDEMGNPLRDELSVDGLTLHFPFGLYRNIGTVIDRHRMGTTGLIVWTCTDGCFQGGVIENGVEKLYNLEEWAKTEEADIDTPMPTECEDEWHVQLEWMNDVEQAFNETFI